MIEHVLLQFPGSPQSWKLEGNASSESALKQGSFLRSVNVTFGRECEFEVPSSVLIGSALVLEQNLPVRKELVVVEMGGGHRKGIPYGANV